MAWQMDPNHSRIEFSVRHMMIAKVRGRFERFDVAVTGDEHNLAAATIHVCIDVASLDSRHEPRDTHLKSSDFFDAARHPTITFRSTRIEQHDARHATIFGDLTIRNVTREVPLDVEYAGKAQSTWGSDVCVGFNATAIINRKSFGLVWNQSLESGGVLVGEDVLIEIEIELLEYADEVIELAKSVAV